MNAKLPRVLARAAAWLEAGRPVALATVVETWGSAPVPVGGQMVIAAEDRFEGSVSGGCVEGDVIAAGLDAIETGKGETLSFGIDDETAWRAGLACGGKIRVNVVRLDTAEGQRLIERVAAAGAAREAIVVATDLATGKRSLYGPCDEAPAAVKSALHSGISVIEKSPQGEIFIHAIVPLPRVLIIGATHVGQVLAELAARTGYDLAVIDPREAFGSQARFGGHRLINAWPETALLDLKPDAFTAVVTLSHMSNIDGEALTIALKSPARYIGALGSRKTHAGRVEVLKAQGFADSDIARIRAPIGLDIGAKTPEEIAVAIIAEIVSVFRKGGGA